MEIFPTWHPDLNRKHFPRSADSEYVAVLAGQRSDGVIVPINVSLVDGTTDQYALAANTEISIPPITIGKVIIQGVDTGGIKHDLLATPNPDGTWNLSLTSPTLALEASQLTQIGLMVDSLLLASQQVAQMSDLITTVATEATQLSVLHELQGLCFNAPSLNQEVTQLSVLQELQGLCFNAPSLNQEITQLSVLQAVEGLSVSTQPPHGKYFSIETSQLGGLTDVLYDFGNRMQDVYLSVSQPVVLKFHDTSNTPVPVLKGQFDFNFQNADKMYVTTTLPTDLKIYANGGTT